MRPAEDLRGALVRTLATASWKYVSAFSRCVRLYETAVNFLAKISRSPYALAATYRSTKSRRLPRLAMAPLTRPV